MAEAAGRYVEDRVGNGVKLGRNDDGHSRAVAFDVKENYAEPLQAPPKWELVQLGAPPKWELLLLGAPLNWELVPPGALLEWERVALEG